jgi:hypothetical protein
MNRFKTTYKGAGPFKVISDWMNAVGSALNNLRGIDIEITENKSTGGYDFRGRSVAAASGLSWYPTASGAEVNLRGGIIVAPGRGHVVVPNQTVTITGGTISTPGWIKCRIQRSNPSGFTFVFELTEPMLAANATHLEWPMARAYRNAAGKAVITEKLHVGAAIPVYLA